MSSHLCVLHKDIVGQFYRRRGIIAWAEIGRNATACVRWCSENFHVNFLRYKLWWKAKFTAMAECSAAREKAIKCGFSHLLRTLFSSIHLLREKTGNMDWRWDPTVCCSRQLRPSVRISHKFIEESFLIRADRCWLRDSILSRRFLWIEGSQTALEKLSQCCEGSPIQPPKLMWKKKVLRMA